MINNTKLHPIPANWEVRSIKSLSKKPVSNGLYKQSEYYGQGISMIHMTEVFAYDVIKDQTMPHVLLNEAEKEKHLLNVGDLVFARRSLKPEGAGDVSIVYPPGEMTYESSIIRVSLNKSDACPEFVFQYLKSEYGKAQMMTIVRQVAVSGITGGDLNNYQIPLPCINEQKKIAQLLSSWDKAIATTEKLIEICLKQKQALMQQLLTGKKRIDGCSDDWKHTKLKVLLNEVKLRNQDLVVDRVLSVTNHSGFVLPADQFSKRVASENVSNYKIVNRGQYGYNPSRLNVGSFARLEDYDIGILSPMYVVFSLNEEKLNSDFFYNWMQSNEAKQRIKNCTQGSVRDSISFDALSSISIKLPSLDEQEKIATVLKIADKEILAIQSRLDLLKQEKKALMQQLLTGKIRVKLEG